MGFSRSTLMASASRSTGGAGTATTRFALSPAVIRDLTRWLGLHALCILLSQGARTQTIYGTVQGTILDPGGKPANNVRVVLTSEQRGTTFSARTNRAGFYIITHVSPDVYDLRIVPGAQGPSNDFVYVSADEEIVHDVQLRQQAGGVVSGNENPLPVQPDRSIRLTRTEIDTLPNFDRNFTEFALLAPGAELKIPQPRPSVNPQGGILISNNGLNHSGSALQLDGIDNRDPATQYIILNPTLESVAEMTVITESYDAQSGQNLGGIITAQTRSGSNKLHGSAFEFRRTDWGQAHNPNLNNPALAEIPPDKLNLFGASLGGPLIRNKLFVFGDYQGNRRSFGDTNALSVPTANVRNTCLDAGPEPCDLSDYGIAIYDPKNGKLFDQMKIPKEDLSPAAVNLLRLLPVSSPNTAAATLVNNYLVTGAETYNDNAFNVRVDQNVSEKMKLFGRYSFADFLLEAPSSFGPEVGGPGLSSNQFAGKSTSRNQGLSTGFDYALKAGLLTDFRFGFFRHHLYQIANGYNTFPAQQAGAPNLNKGDSLTSGMPEITIVQTGVANSNIVFGDGLAVNQCNCPLLENSQEFQFVSNWTRSHNTHLIKWGADFRYFQDTRFSSDQHRPGELSFNRKFTQGSDPSAGLGLATFLLGDVTGFDRFVSGLTDAGQRQKRLYLYAQDTWRIASTVTINYGLRWEIYFPQSVTGKNNGGWLDLGTGNVLVAGYECCNLSGNVRNTLLNIAPRVSLAYQVARNTVIRAAYGRSFDGATAQIFGNSFTANPPVELSQTLQPKPGEGYPLVPAFSLDRGPTDPQSDLLFPNVPATGQIPLPDGISAGALPPRLQLPTVDLWNFTIQRQITSKLNIEGGYVGNKGSHLTPVVNGSFYNINQRTIVGYAADKCYANPQPAACLSRYPFYSTHGWTQPINYYGDTASANYNALQATISYRRNQSLQFGLNYSFAKGLAYNDNYYNIDPGLNYGPNDWDARQRLVFWNFAEIPVGRGKKLLGDLSPLADHFLGGWVVSSVTTWRTGLPFSPTYASSECTHDRDTGPCRPNIVGRVAISENRNGYFTTTAGDALAAGPNDGSAPGAPIGPWQRPAVGSFGGAARNSFRGPGFFDTDLAVIKNIHAGERYTVQFRAEFLNVFNYVNLGNPNGCVDCDISTAAVITTLATGASQRQIEFALRFRF
jgi:Carboxypeptidase regulatory-like domain/TonB dependent receptor